MLSFKGSLIQDIAEIPCDLQCFLFNVAGKRPERACILNSGHGSGIETVGTGADKYTHIHELALVIEHKRDGHLSLLAFVDGILRILPDIKYLQLQLVEIYLPDPAFGLKAYAFLVIFHP